MVRPVVVAAAVLLVAALSGATRAKDEKQLAMEEVVEQQTQFGMEMYSVVTSYAETKNIFFSPVSICTALTMVHRGSRGSTAKQLEEVLGIKNSRKRTARGYQRLMRLMQRQYQQDEVTTKMTNRVYTSEHLNVRPGFARRLQRSFRAQLEQLDFGLSQQAADTINQNVKNDTDGHITDLVDPDTLNADVAMMLVNAIYFKGAWLMQFDPSETTEADFYTPEGVARVQMMKTEKSFPVGTWRELPGMRILRLPYKGEETSMTIFLPNEAEDIYQLDHRAILSLDFEGLMYGLDLERVEVQLPIFKMEEEIDLKKILRKMGILSLFDVTAANLRGIARDAGLFVSSAVHKAAIEVTEKGTTASGATAIGISWRMYKPPPEPFIVNRPFFFVVRDDKTGAILFLGRFVEP